jgi:hypothetical protein
VRKLILFILIAALILGGIAIYLISTTPRTGRGLSFPLTETQHALLSSIPANADVIALVPSAAALQARLEENPVTRDLVATWASERRLPRPWMLGDADLAIWHAGDRTSYSFRLDPLRAFLVRTYLLITGGGVKVEGTTFIVGERAEENLITEESLASLVQLAPADARGDALVIQRTESQMFPPVDRPALSVVTLGPRDITIVSRAASTEPAGPSRTVSLPDGALLSAWFGEPPRLIADIDRLLPGDIGKLLGDGGSAVLYDVESRRLLPRPKGLFVVANTPEARSAAGGLRGLAELLGEVATREDRLLIGLDRTSVAAYDAETFSGLPFPASEWALRMDARRMVPMLERLGDNTGLRFAAPRLSRSVRDLRSWIRHLENAGRIEAMLTAGTGHEELRVRITAK